ncbi:phage minor head protein [Thiomicrorhabdus sp. Kp2]|uniref:phage head morphogenesis protein n=1 Tax=Thiomicrorhabdus sp. Kp2 TaxID=1123518 RepID=UPI0004245FBA|nr:phage minor head protein [Thiomicrorhabdus sp. Kp2]
MPVKYNQPPLPKETLKWFKSKGIQPSFNWKDVWQEEHAIAFTVAKATEFDVLEAIKLATQQAISQGQTLAQFQKELKPQLIKLGWWGRQDKTDPLTSETYEVQLGSPRRLKVIYRTNLRTARAAGQYERAQKTKAAMPYLMYELGPSRNHRDEHVSWSRIILPIDHPFWQTHYPPNGWGCKCRVRQISAAEAERLGGVSKDPHIQYRDWLNERTGELLQVPQGIDPGWDYNPGIARLKSLDEHLYRKSPGLVKHTLQSDIRQQHYQSWLKKVYDDNLRKGRSISVAVMQSTVLGFMAKHLKTPQGLVTLDDRLLVGKKSQRHDAQGNSPTYQQWSDLPQLIQQPHQVLWDRKNKTVLYLVKTEQGMLKIAVNGQGKIATVYQVQTKDLEDLIQSGDYEVIE